jgi:hypothetical protein
MTARTGAGGAARRTARAVASGIGVPISCAAKRSA